MKKILSLLFAVMAMGIAMVVVASLLHIDVKAEIEHLRAGKATDEELPSELPEV